MTDIQLDYDSLMQDALRKVVHDVLAITAELKETPGEHHFYIEFKTYAEGVSIPDHLRESYPSRMTIVIHHQFENLVVERDHFEVTLWFKGVETHLTIPFDAMTSFADPSTKIGLRFDQDDPPAMDEASSPSGTEEKNNSDRQSGDNTVQMFSAQKGGSEKATDKTEKTSKNSSTDDQIADDNLNENENRTNLSEDEPSQNESADVVSLDSFRKK